MSRRLLPSPFRLKIVLWYAAILLLTLLAFRVATVGIIRSSLHADLDESLRAEALWIRDLLRSYRGREIPDSEIVDEVSRRSRLSPRKEFIEVYDRDGREYFRSPNLGPGTLRDLAVEASDDGRGPWETRDHRDLSIRLIGLRETDYEIYVAYPLTDVDAAVDNTVSSFLYLIPLALVLAIGGGLFLISRFLAPVRWLDRHAEELVALPLDRDLPAPPGAPRDEVDRLVERIHDIVGRMRAGVRRSLGFSSLASHELRTPLAVIRSTLEEALRPEATREEAGEALSATYDEVLRLERVVEDLLSLSAIEARTIRLALEPVDLGALAAAFAEDAETLCAATGVGFSFERGPEAIAPVDADRLRQVLFNLLDNALKHTDPGGHIRLAQEVDGGRGLLVLSDDGAGIPEEHLDRIFDPFFRPPGGRRRGVGVGLALVRWLVEAHGGEVTVRSRQGHGTTFTLHLPLQGPESAT